jgi:Icc protein
MNILQFTDCHLFKDDAARLCGMDTAASLNAVVKSAFESSHWPPDAVIFTGDISQDETEASYRRFLNVFEPIEVPVFCLPGNHDVPAKLESILDADNVHTSRQILTDKWQVLLLDSTVYKQNAGFLRQDELNYLDQCLSVHEELHTLICLHHNVIDTGTSWVDTMTVKNAAEFFAVLDKHPNAKAVLTGHIHHALAQTYKEIPIYGTPSTCIQFKPGSARFQLDTLAPGYRWLELKSNGAVKTGIERVEDFDFTPDPKATGY